MANHKEIRQKGAATYRKMGDSLPKDCMKEMTVTKMGNQGSSTTAHQVKVNTPISRNGGSCGNPKNSH